MAMETRDKIGSISRTSIACFSLQKTIMAEQMITRTAPGRKYKLENIFKAKPKLELTANISRQLVDLLRLVLDFGFFGVGNFPSVSHDAIHNENITVFRQLQEAALVISVAADQQVTDAVENQAERSENDANLVRVTMELVLVRNVIVVFDVEKCLDDFDDNGEAERCQEGAHNHHSQHVDARPAKRVFQRLLVLPLLFSFLAHVLRDDFLLLLVFAELGDLFV